MTAEPPAAGTTTSAPLLRVVRGNPDPAELAAVVATVTALTAAVPPPPAPAPSAWAAPARQHRAPPAPGPGAWRVSGLPG